MSTEADIVMNFEASAAVGAVICSLGGTPVNANHIEYWKAQATKARQQSVGLAAKIIEMQAEITKLRAERDGAARDMRERCAKVADDFIGYSGEGSEGDNDLIGMFARGNRNAKRRIGNLIRAMPTSVIATDRVAND